MARTSTAQKLGKRMKELREAAGLSQEKLSHASGVSQTYISGIEHGRRNPSLTTLNKLAKGLGIHIDAILNLGDYQQTDRSRLID